MYLDSENSWRFFGLELNPLNDYNFLSYVIGQQLLPVAEMPYKCQETKASLLLGQLSYTFYGVLIFIYLVILTFIWHLCHRQQLLANDIGPKIIVNGMNIYSFHPNQSQELR